MVGKPRETYLIFQPHGKKLPLVKTERRSFDVFPSGSGCFEAKCTPVLVLKGTNANLLFQSPLFGCGSKFNRRGRPQVLVHVSAYQGSILAPVF